MKNICFILNGSLPVPAVKGGAIEQLVELLIRQNEQNQMFNFTVVGPFCPVALESQASFRYTKFVNIHYSLKWNQYLGTVRAIAYKLFKRDFPLLSLYNYKVDKFLLDKGKEYDFIVNEHADDGLFQSASKEYGRERFINHFHMVTKSSPIILKSFHKYISVSNYVKLFFEESSDSKWPCIHNVLYNHTDIKRFDKRVSVSERIRLRKQFGLNEDDFIILYCGRIKDFKGVLQLVEAVTSINDDKLKLIIVGASEVTDKISDYEKIVRKKASEQPGRFVLTGYVDNSRIYEYYNISDIGIIPSTCEESFNMVILEMMASGLPTIATISGGMVEVGTNDTTIFVDKDENMVENLKKAILQLYDSPQKRESMSEAGKKRAATFDGKYYLSEFSDIICSY